MNARNGKNETAMELSGDTDIVMTRTFNAPPRVVFDAWTRPELVQKWWAPKSHGVSFVSCEGDVRPGGKYRWVLGRGDEVIPFSGTYREVTPHSRLVYSQVFEPMADAGESVITTTFEEQEGKTRMRSVEHYPSAQVRAMVLETGMESGAREVIEQLEALLPSLL